METIVDVTVVPIFAPITMGTAFSRERIPAATKPTTVQVVVEELCTRLVARIPIKRPTKGLDVLLISRSANPPPNISNPVPRSLAGCS
jgi:hypothetical protein